MRAFIVVVLLLVSTTPAWACSFEGVDEFQPTLREFERYPGPKQDNPDAIGEHFEAIPAPVVDVAEVVRGRASATRGDCSDAGTIILYITLPADSHYRIEDFGVYFRIRKGKQPDEIFPDYPVVGTVDGRRMRVAFHWLDGAPSGQSPLDLDVEAFFVANDLGIGGSTEFAVKSVARERVEL